MRIDLHHMLKGKGKNPLTPNKIENLLLLI